MGPLPRYYNWYPTLNSAVFWLTLAEPSTSANFVGMDRPNTSFRFHWWWSPLLKREQVGKRLAEMLRGKKGQLELNLTSLQVTSIPAFLDYRISSYNSFLNFEIQRSQYIRPKVTVHKFAETIQGRKLYMIAYKNNRNKFSTPVIFHKMTCLLRSLKL